MSTRANVVVKDGDSCLWFYRHSDGYPAGAMPTLLEFLRRVKSNQIRDNLSQSCGWLIVIGHEEYAESRRQHPSISGWKVGAYEPTTGRHGDIEFLYTIDLNEKTIVCATADGAPVDLSQFKP